MNQNNAPKNTVEKSNSSRVFIFAGLGLLTILVLIVFTRAAWTDAVDKTTKSYNHSAGLLAPPNTIGNSILDIPDVLASDPVKGSIDPTLTIIEFGDFECPYCGDLALALDAALLDYPEVQVVWKDLPNPTHINARPAASAARCAQEQGSFWEFHDFLFTNQETLGTELYTGIAQELQLDSDAFAACVAENRYGNIVNAGFDIADDYGVTGTPYLFVGETRVDQGISYETLASIIEESLQ